MTLARHLVSILLLPFMVTVIVPSWLLTVFTRGDGAAFGGILLVAGLMLFLWCVALFARFGQGTLAPWDPTRKMVAAGPYRFVRNPMITGVALILAGEALLWESGAVAIWAGLFILINHLYFILVEEPGLETRFGEPYRIYKANVPRWLPRLRRQAE